MFALGHERLQVSPMAYDRPSRSRSFRIDTSGAVREFWTHIAMPRFEGGRVRNAVHLGIRRRKKETTSNCLHAPFWHFFTGSIVEVSPKPGMDPGAPISAWSRPRQCVSASGRSRPACSPATEWERRACNEREPTRGPVWIARRVARRASSRAAGVKNSLSRFRSWWRA
jgi:hypothetical protein